MNKKGVSQIVTTILIILLVLAAIVIVWQVVERFVKKGGSAIEEKAQCFDVSLELVENGVSCNKTSGVVAARVSRGSDSAGNIDMKVVVEDTVQTQEAAPASLGTKNAAITYDATGKNEIVVKVAPVVGEDLSVTCDPTDELTVTCVV